MNAISTKGCGVNDVPVSSCAHDQGECDATPCPCLRYPEGCNMPPVNEREFAKLEAEVIHLREATERLTLKVEALDSTLQSVRGGWVVLAALGGISLSIGGLIVAAWRLFR